MIGADLARALDPVRFMRDASGHVAHAWQAQVLRSTARRSILLCRRQAGKSTVVAALASHMAIYEPNSLVLLCAPAQRQSSEIFRKIVEFVRGAGTVDFDAESAMRVEFPNGSRIVNLSGNPLTVRGYSGPRLVVLDEAAFFADDRLYHAVTPMLQAGGRLVLISTPNGKRGFFWNAWENGGDVWERTRIGAEDEPRVREGFLAEEREDKPDWLIRQEYFVEFVDTDEQVFGSEMVAASITPDVAPLFSTPFVF